MVADRALTPATRLRLGEPLPHQLADRTQASLKAQKLYFSVTAKDYRVLPHLSVSYSQL